MSAMRIARFNGIYFRAPSLSWAVAELRADHYLYKDEDADAPESLWAELKIWAHIRYCRLMKRRNRYELKDYMAQRHILGDLRDYVRLGFGYSLPRTSDAIPEFIPVDVWKGTVDWENSTVAGGGREYVDVRLVHLWTEDVPFTGAANIDARVKVRVQEVLSDFIPLVNPAPEQPVPQPSGDAETALVPAQEPPHDGITRSRPSDLRKTASIEVARRLKAAGLLTAATPHKEAVGAVIKAVAEQDPALADRLRKLGTRSIYEYFRDSLN